MKKIIIAVVVIVMLASLSVTVVLADPSGPNSGEFGPSWCDDGSYVEVIVHAGKLTTGHYPDSTRVGIAFTEYLVNAEGEIVAEWLYTPGKRPKATWCTWIIPGLGDGWTVQGEVLITPAEPKQ